MWQYAVSIVAGKDDGVDCWRHHVEVHDIDDGLEDIDLLVPNGVTIGPFQFATCGLYANTGP